MAKNKGKIKSRNNLQFLKRGNQAASLVDNLQTFGIKYVKYVSPFHISQVSEL